MEVIVTIGVFSVIMSGVTLMFTTSWKNYNYIMSTNSASIAANQGMSNIINILRRVRNADNGSYPIESVGDFDLIVFSDLDKDGITERVHYYLNSGNMVVGTSEPSGFPLTYPGTDTTTDIVIKNITNEATEPIFYYYDNANALLSTPVSNLIDVKMIGVNLIIEKRDGDLNIESFASLRNLSDHDRIE